MKDIYSSTRNYYYGGQRSLLKMNFYYRFNVRKSLVAKNSATNGYEHTKCSPGTLLDFGISINLFYLT
jgi:hypothetical protein